MNKIAKKLIKDYREKRPGAEKQPLAIFEFSTNKKLAREKIGFAVSELLIQKFVKSSEFDVVERTKIARIMKEQHFQMTGAVDSKTAVQVGKLIGAKVLLLGSVQKLGKNYQVTARLVEVESGLVVATSFEEFPAAMFEVEAQPYLALVPEKQAIGFYALYNYRHNRNNLPRINTPVEGQPGVTTPKSFSLSMAGVGIKYFPATNYVIDIAGAITTNRPEVANFSGDAGGYLGQIANLSMGRGYYFRGYVAWVRSWKKRSRTYLGAGLTYFRTTPSSSLAAIQFNVLRPLIRAGYEFRPQPRIGAGFFINYEFGSPKGRSSFVNADIVELGKLSFEPTLALYF